MVNERLHEQGAAIDTTCSAGASQGSCLVTRFGSVGLQSKSGHPFASAQRLQQFQTEAQLDCDDVMRLLTQCCSLPSGSQG